MIIPAVPQFLSPGVPAPFGAKQTQFLATNEYDVPLAAKLAVAVYEAGDPPAEVWVPNAEGGFTETPAGELV